MCSNATKCASPPQQTATRLENQRIANRARRPWRPRSESGSGAVRLGFDRRLMLRFRGSLVTSDAGLLVYRELDDVLGLTEMAGDVLADARSGKNGRHALAGLFRQSVFGRLPGYEDVNEPTEGVRPNAREWSAPLGPDSLRLVI
jgi:hypothetical protein